MVTIIKHLSKLSVTSFILLNISTTIESASTSSFIFRHKKFLHFLPFPKSTNLFQLRSHPNNLSPLRPQHPQLLSILHIFDSVVDISSITVLLQLVDLIPCVHRFHQFGFDEPFPLQAFVSSDLLQYLISLMCLSLLFLLLLNMLWCSDKIGYDRYLVHQSLALIMFSMPFGWRSWWLQRDWLHLNKGLLLLCQILCKRLHILLWKKVMFIIRDLNNCIPTSWSSSLVNL